MSLKSLSSSDVSNPCHSTGFTEGLDKPTAHFDPDIFSKKKFFPSDPSSKSNLSQRAHRWVRNFFQNLRSGWETGGKEKLAGAFEPLVEYMRDDFLMVLTGPMFVGLVGFCSTLPLWPLLFLYNPAGMLILAAFCLGPFVLAALIVAPAAALWFTGKSLVDASQVLYKLIKGAAVNA